MEQSKIIDTLETYHYDLEGIKERIKRNKEIILILWRVMTSHIKSMMNKSC